MLKGILCAWERCSAFPLMLPLVEIQSLSSSSYSGWTESAVRARCLVNVTRTYRLLTNSTSISIGFGGNSCLSAHHTDFVEETNRRKFIGLKFERFSIKMSTSLVLRLLASSVRVADRAGNIIRDIMSKGDLQIVDKGVNDLQTEADRSVQRCILASLHSQFPDVTIIGEEEPTADLDADWVELSQSDEVLACDAKLPQDLRNVVEKDICVWVDPLDGTNEYTQGLLDHVTVLIGIAVNGKAVAGVMHQPYYNYKAGPGASLGRTIWGVVGVGTYGIERKFLSQDSKIIVTTRSHETEAVRDAIAACEPTEVLRVGGAGHKVLLLVEGEAHAYVFASPGCKKWDTCAPEAVLRAMGGMLTDIHGNDFQYHPDVVRQNTGGVLATAFAGDHAGYLSRMPEEVKAVLPSS